MKVYKKNNNKIVYKFHICYVQTSDSRVVRDGHLRLILGRFKTGGFHLIYCAFLSSAATPGRDRVQYFFTACST